MDPFVELVIQDPTREHEEDQRQISTCVPNEPSPRWGDKFDFIDVSPSSSLLVTVWDKKGTLESFMSFKALKGTLSPGLAANRYLGSLCTGHTWLVKVSEEQARLQHTARCW